MGRNITESSRGFYKKTDIYPISALWEGGVYWNHGGKYYTQRKTRGNILKNFLGNLDIFPHIPHLE